MTVEAVKRAALGRAKVGHVFCHELTDTELQQISTYSPDLILLAGGTDGAIKCYYPKFQKLAKLDNTPIIVAGNKVAAPIVEKPKTSHKEVHITENVMPKLEYKYRTCEKDHQKCILDKIPMQKAFIK